MRRWSEAMLALNALNAILCVLGEREAVKYYSRPKRWDSPLVEYWSSLC